MTIRDIPILAFLLVFLPLLLLFNLIHALIYGY